MNLLLVKWRLRQPPHQARAIRVRGIRAGMLLSLLLVEEQTILEDQYPPPAANQRWSTQRLITSLMLMFDWGNVLYV